MATLGTQCMHTLQAGLSHSFIQEGENGYVDSLNNACARKARNAWKKRTALKLPRNFLADG